MKPREAYPKKVREFCISLHYHSPVAYRFIRKSFGNHIPHERTISAWLSNSDIDAEDGIRENTIRRVTKIVDSMNGDPLICSLIFNEMKIREQAFWCIHSKKEQGYVTYGKNSTVTAENAGKLQMATQAIVFMLSGINMFFRLPVCYHFIDSLNAIEKESLTSDLITQITSCGVDINNLTFDGHKSNISMCNILGANLNVDAQDFRPYFTNRVDSKKIYLIFDPSHMFKLLRNTLANKKIFFDEDNNEIMWSYFEDLESISREKGFLTHKINKKHIQWKDSIMNVRIAVETLSNSVADSMEYLMQTNHPNFVNATATIKFIRMVDKLFDIFNSQSLREPNIFKRALNSENVRIVLSHFEECEKYLMSLRLTNKNGVKIRIVDSPSRTGFIGFLVDMKSLSMMFEEYLVRDAIMTSIATYSLSQDHIEIFFGKLRAKSGFNDNPNVAQFKGAYKRLLLNASVMAPQSTNCREFDFDTLDYSPFTNVYFVSSRKPTHDIVIDSNFHQEIVIEREEINKRICTLEQMKSSDYLLDNLTAANTAYVARSIEEKIESATQFFCAKCKPIFVENKKVDECYMSSKTLQRPCLSTYNICKIADKFLYTIKQVTEDKNTTRFTI